MPIQKRTKKYVFSNKLKTSSKRSRKEEIVEEIRENIEKYRNLYVFTFENPRNAWFNQLRDEFKEDGRMFLAKKTLMKVALGKTEAEEVQPGLSQVAEQVYGFCGILCTDRDREETQEIFDNFERQDYPRSGFVPQETVTISAGPIDWAPVSMEPLLRRLGLPVQIIKGTVHIPFDHVVCRAGEEINSSQSKILKIFRKPLAKFKVQLVCHWHDGVVHNLVDRPPQDKSE
eukprot:gb/GECH01015009.1/.p1 GENE.gb/GECH01015009.1/~~gb/GECH01015009.1/.p1  ORF type:complete len:230 (+),score=69.91 gb/GECH01015009.1/:1-690(+)